MKHSIIALATFSLLALSTSRADSVDTASDVVSLPAFVVEATRVDLPSAGLSADFDATVGEAAALAERASDRSLNRLRSRLAPGGRHFARGAGAPVRSRA
jgi:hypothetical protein